MYWPNCLNAWLHTKCDQFIKNSAHPAFQTGNRYIDIELCSSEKIEVISYLVPKLWNEMHCGCGMQLFGNLPHTIALCKIDTCSYKKAAWKSARTDGKKEVVKVGGYIVSVDKKTTKYRLEAYEIAFFENPCQAVHSNVFPYFPDLPVSSCLASL